MLEDESKLSPFCPLLVVKFTLSWRSPCSSLLAKSTSESVSFSDVS
uniref:Uncharacterized protein n=1 Tax=Ciona intestinalis TaxID=7719 RepID=H2XW14_CIOIN